MALGDCHEDFIHISEQSILCFVSKSSATSQYDNDSVIKHGMINITGPKVMLGSAFLLFYFEV
jgi:hypothetical protein